MRTNEEVRDFHRENLARRLHAAFESARLGLSSVDRTLKRHAHDNVGPYWLGLADLVTHDTNGLAQKLFDEMGLGQPSGPRLMK